MIKSEDAFFFLSQFFRSKKIEKYALLSTIAGIAAPFNLPFSSFFCIFSWEK